jgi:hypothetical protein
MSECARFCHQGKLSSFVALRWLALFEKLKLRVSDVVANPDAVVANLPGDVDEDIKVCAYEVHYSALTVPA